MEEKKELQRINLQFFGLKAKVPFDIEPETEPVIRDATKFINGRVEEYMNRFPNKTITEVLYLCLLQEEVKLMESRADNAAAKMEEEVENLDRQLKEYMVSR